jgi:hypothetical protein
MTTSTRRAQAAMPRLQPNSVHARGTTPKRARTALGLLPAVLFTTLAVEARADEGMWPFDMVPRAEIEKRHGVTLDDAWLERVRLSSVRFNNGGSGSFVSASGLVLTNHHVASDCIAKLATATKDVLADGFVAASQADEVRCPDLELNQLVSIEDVTARVQAARKDGMSDKDANVAMKRAMSALEKECAEATKLRCDVVTLYAGGKYHLYRYRKYTDVRLAFAPEKAIAFFGGDADNFTYPRYNLDMTLMRVYEGGQPFRPAHFLPWNAAGPKENEVVFVSGHPGSTGRMQTVAELERLRDLVYPYALDRLTRDRNALRTYAATGREAARQVTEPLFGIENAIKALSGFQRGLRDPKLMNKKRADEAELRAAIAKDEKLAVTYGGAFEEIAAAQKALDGVYKPYAVLEQGARTPLFEIARTLLRLSAELEKPNDQRLREYRDTNLESVKLGLLSPAPIYGGVEAVSLASWLERLRRDLGDADPTVREVLAGKPAMRVAHEIVAGSKLTDIRARRRLLDGGQAAVAASRDPMIALVRAIDAAARSVRARYEDEVEAPMRTNGERIARATFAVRGTGTPPDATFTLRLSTGVVRGYVEGGKAIPPMTDFAGLYAHADPKAKDRTLPPRWVEKRASIDPKMPFNFVSTNDIIGGNSGSPVVNAKGELVGLIFDGNLSSLPNRFVYGETTERAVSVHSGAMTHALERVYSAKALADELRGAGR